MNWTLNAGGAITRTCRGLPDFGGFFPPSSRPIPYGISTWCTNYDSADPTNYYDYIQKVLEGVADSQPDLFSFNFMGYSGQIIFDQQGKAYTIPTQPIDIQPPHGVDANYWVLKTPDGATYRFASEETSNYSPTAWYLTQIQSADHEQIDFQYQPYTTELTYPNPYTTNAISTQTVFAGPYHCETCPRKLSIADRPTTHIGGQYLRRITSATHRVDFFSTATRSDQPGAHQLNSVRLTYLADSSRRLEYRFRYAYYDPEAKDRLFLQQVQKFGLSEGAQEVAEPPYTFTYVPAPSMSRETAPVRGTYAIDRWGYYNAAINQNPFLPLTVQNYQQLPPANRNTNPAAVTFGLLRQITYPTGGTTTLTFESNDFNNVAKPLPITVDSSQTAVAQSDGTGAENSSYPITFTLTHAQQVRFTYTANPSGSNTDEITEFDTQATLYAAAPEAPSTFTRIDGLNYPSALASRLLLRTLPAGTYRLVVSANVWRAMQAQIYVQYTQRQAQQPTKQVGGGTRIRRIVTFDGLNHANDQTKEYYYDNEQHTRSTGKLTHQPVFHSTFSYIRVNSGQGSGEGEENSCFIALGQEWECKYWIHAAEDLAAASGTAQGSAVGYDTVTVVQRDRGTTLRTTSIFHNVAAATVTLDDQAVENQGFIPVNFDTQNGLLLQTLDYRVATGGDAFRPTDAHLVRAVAHQYGSPLVPETAIMGLSIGGAFGDLTAASREPCRTILAQSYTTRVGWWPLTQTQETLYDEAGRATTTTTRLLYENAAHLQPSRKEVTTVAGTTHVTRYKYALDYAPSADAGIRLLQNQHQVLTPVEQQQWVQAAGQPAQWVGGTVTRFSATPTGVIVPTTHYQASLLSPQARLVEATGADQQYTDLLPSSAYEPRVLLRYNPNGTLRQQAAVHAQPTSYLWGYAHLYPIAEAKNTAYTQVAFTSFEPAASGRWRYDSIGTHRVSGGYTGRWAYQVDGTAAGNISCPNLPAGSYELTYWASVPKGTIGLNLTLSTGAVSSSNQLLATRSDGWKLYRNRFQLRTPGTISLNGQGGRVDEVRLYPVGAQLTSYTYDPLAGPTSQTGPDGRTVFYEYDGLGRLVRTRDEQGRILSQQQYHYAGK
jgi:YD repeat-containing protein